MGIAGIINNKQSKVSIASMIETMKHESFYKSDAYEPDYVSLGATGISSEILLNDKKTIVCLVGGEAFCNDSSKSLLQLYEEKGIDFVNGIKGQFVIVIYEIPARKIFIITDRYGFKPLYYIQDGNNFIFASEVKAIIKHLKSAPAINSSALAEYAIFNYPLGDNTFIKNIYRMPAGAIWELSIEADSSLRLQKNKYWEFESIINNSFLTEEESLEQCGRVFKRTVSQLLSKESNIGLTLTGGYDSRTILSAIDCNNYKVAAFTYGAKDSEQCIIAKRLAEAVKCEHIIQEFDTGFNNTIDELLNKTAWLTDGLCNILHAELLYVFKNSRNLINPCFTGLGGSEIIRGLQDTGLPLSRNLKQIILSSIPEQTLNSIVKEDSSYGLFSKDFIDCNKGKVELGIPSELSTNKKALSFTLFEVFRKYYGAMTALENFYVKVRLPYMDYDFVDFVLSTPFSILHTKQFSNNPFCRLKGQQLSANIIKFNNPILLSIPTDRGYPPSLNLSPASLPIIWFHNIYRRLYHPSVPSSSDSVLRSAIKKIIDNSQTQKREYYNSKKLKEVNESYPHWSLETWQEVTKVATFELWLRQL